MIRELPTGKGFADICLIPRKKYAQKPAVIIELKWDKSAEGAIAQIKENMLQHGAINAMMSGSGPTVFGLFEDEEQAKRAFAAMKKSGLAKQVYLTSIYNNARI